MSIDISNVSAISRSTYSWLDNSREGLASQNTGETNAAKKNTEDSSRSIEFLTNPQNKFEILEGVSLSFSVHESSGKVMVIVIDDKTGKILREIPSSETLDLAAKLKNVIGLLFDSRV